MLYTRPLADFLLMSLDALNPWRTHLEKRLGPEWHNILLVVLAALAVLTWIVSQLKSWWNGLRTPVPAKRVASRRWRIWLESGVLVLASGVAYREWSVHAEARRILKSVSVLRSHNFLYTIQETDAFIGRQGEVASTQEIGAFIERRGHVASTDPSTIPLHVAYRWKGVFRIHTLYAEFTPRSGVYVLTWIDDVLN